MADTIPKQKDPPLSDNSQPIIESPDFIYPARHSSVVTVPVTPGSHSKPASSLAVPCSANDIANTPESTSDYQAEATPSVQSDLEILQGINLKERRAGSKSIGNLDPKAANPSLGLSGRIISAAFCIPYLLQHREGQEWVGEYIAWHYSILTVCAGPGVSAWYICTLRLFHASCLK